MSSRIFKVLLLLSTTCLLSCNESSKNEYYNLIIQRVSIIDVTDGSVSPPQNVGIIGNKIFKIQSHEMVGDHVIDGQGLFLSPAFIDTHVHLSFIKNAYEIQTRV